MSAGVFLFGALMSTDFWFESAGVRLYAVTAGDGFPVILFHGGLANHLACRVFAEPLAARYRVVTPDARAAGRSVFAGELTWDLLADDVAALVRHLGASRAAIGGISAGAGVAVRAALRHPELVAALVVLHPTFAGADVGLTPEQASAMAAMDAAGSRAVAEGISVLYPLFDPLPPAIRERARAIVPTYDPASVAATTRFLASGAQPFATGGELAQIAAPTLLVPGVDPYHPREVAEIYRRHIRDYTVVDTLDFAGAIADFLIRCVTPTR